MKGTTRLLVAVAAVCIVGGGAFFGIRRITRDGGPDASAFFAVPTPQACARGALDLSLAHASFAASFAGNGPAQGGKFLVVTLDATNRASTQHAGLRPSFQLRDLDGGVHEAEAASGTWTALSAGASAEGTLAFGVPLNVGAAKLVYDDGCTHHEWVVP